MSLKIRNLWLHLLCVALKLNSSEDYGWQNRERLVPEKLYLILSGSVWKNNFLCSSENWTNFLLLYEEGQKKSKRTWRHLWTALNTLRGNEIWVKTILPEGDLIYANIKTLLWQFCVPPNCRLPVLNIFGAIRCLQICFVDVLHFL